MKFHKKYLQTTLFVLILITLIMAGGPASAVANDSQTPTFELQTELIAEDGVVSARENGVDLVSSSAAWTPARMAAAQPYPLPQVNSNSEFPGTTLGSTLDPVYLPSVPPTDDLPGEDFVVDTLVQADQSGAVYDYPAPYTRYENFDSYQVFPYSAVGVLFFTQRGTDYRCSAAVVGENALWTAGHCVHDGSDETEGWSQNVAFVPAYKDGNEPYGRWDEFDLVTRSAWFSNGDLRFDIGGVILNQNGSNQSIQEVVGSLGFAYNLTPKQHWFTLGYPSDSPFNGSRMQICAGSFARNASSYGEPYPMGMGCDMTGGSSGGPWVIDFSGVNGNTNYVNGNSSFRVLNETEEIYSPYFGDAAKDLLDFISSNTKLSTNMHIPFISKSGNP